MPEELLGLLRLCLLALLYLFFLRVVWAVLAELRGPRARRPVAAAPVAAPRAGGPPPPAPATAPGAAAGRRRGRNTASGVLVVRQPAAAQGTRFEVADECVMGRGAGCQIHLDDTFASQLHARVFRRDGLLHVEDLASTNGTFVNGRRITGPAALRAGDQVQVGETVLEVR